METVAISSAPLSSSGTATAAPASAVAWGAIVAGAVAAVATSIVLLTLGAGLGLTAVSPWSGEGATATTIGVAAVIWLVIVQWLSAGLGGYITGRLRVRWSYFGSDEVFFRDTVHGFLSWALAVAAVAVFTTAMASGVMTGVASGAAERAPSAERSLDYFSDSLYRSENPAMAPAINPRLSSDEVRGESTRILARNLGESSNDTDRAYLARLVAARTGMSDTEARTRVDQVITDAKQAADSARKAGAAFAIATALSLVIGAFIAAVAAALGGRERDD